MSSPKNFNVFGRTGRRKKRKAAMQGMKLEQYIPSNLSFPSTVSPAQSGPVSATEISSGMDALSDDLQMLYDAVLSASFQMQEKIDNAVNNAAGHADMLSKSRYYLDAAQWIDFASSCDINHELTSLEFAPSGGMRLQSLTAPTHLYDYKTIGMRHSLPGSTLSTKQYGHIESDLSQGIPWMFVARSEADGPAHIDVVFDLGSAKNVSKVIVTRVKTSPMDDMVMRVSTSPDNVTWKEVALTDMSPSGEVTFAQENVRYVMTRFEKVGMDSYDTNKGGFTFRWMIRSVVIGWSEHYESGTVVTNVISPGKVFSSLSIALDKYMPDDCNYTVDIATGRDGTVGPWYQVTEDKPLKLKTHTHVTSGVSLGVRNVELAIASLSAVIMSDAQYETLRVFKNVGATGEGRMVPGGSPMGWRLVQPYYSCVVRNYNEKVIDVGGNSIYVDGTPRVGRIVLSAGIHSISIHESIWSTLAPDTSAKQDTMYPFNVRYIVEGHPTIKTYTGFDMFAGGIMERVTYFQLMTHQSNVNDYSYALYDDSVWIEYIDTFNECETEETIREVYRIEYIRDIHPTPDCFAVRINLYSKDSPLTPIIRAARIELGGQT